ncbi:MAG: T9SS type A sorting domain-containing protein, partial [Bacteroidota bacterium]|nr:T9SS type A sorting domain-containing protein [Bacteroidota bacterium]
VDIYLEDREEQTFTDLKNGDFSITPTANLSGTGRFYLVFGTNSLGSDDFDMSHISAYKPFNADHLVIEGLFNIETASVSMYNIIGQEVLNIKLNANQAIERVSTIGLNAGVYIVNIQADNNTITKKIIIN